MNNIRNFIASVGATAILMTSPASADTIDDNKNKVIKVLDDSSEFMYGNLESNCIPFEYYNKISEKQSLNDALKKGFEELIIVLQDPSKGPKFKNLLMKNGLTTFEEEDIKNIYSSFIGALYLAEEIGELESIKDFLSQSIFSNIKNEVSLEIEDMIGELRELLSNPDLSPKEVKTIFSDNNGDFKSKVLGLGNITNDRIRVVYDSSRVNSVHNVSTLEYEVIFKSLEEQILKLETM